MDSLLNFSFEQEWSALLAQGVHRSFRAGELLYMQGDPYVGLFCLTSGRIKNCVYFHNGSEKITSVQAAPCFTGETALIDGGTNLFTVYALTDVDATIIPSETARAYLIEHPSAMAMLLHSYAKKMRSVQLQAESAVLSVPQKVAHMLINCEAYGVFNQNDPAELHVTHEQLASYLNTTRPKITNVLNAFEQANLIQKGRGTIRILNKTGLLAVLRS